MKKEIINPDVFYTSEEVTEILNVSLRTTQRILKSGNLPSFRINGQYRIKGIDILNFLSNVRYDNITISESEKEKPADLIPMLEVYSINLEISPNLNSLFEPQDKSEVLLSLNNMRKKIITELGFIMPGVRFNDNTELKENSYSILINGTSVSNGKLFTNKLFAYSTDKADIKLSENMYLKPITKEKGYWVEKELKEEAESKGFIILTPEELLLDHINFIIRKFAHEIISKDEVFLIIENLRKNYPIVVEEVIQDNNNESNKLSIGKITKILKELLREQISIRNIRLILESLGDFIEETTDPEILVELLRKSLSNQICSKLVDNDSEEGIINVLGLDTDLEKTLIEGIKTNELGKKEFYISSDISSSIIAKIKEFKDIKVIICSPLVRKYLKQILERNFPNISVLSYQEIGKEFKVNCVGMIKI
ncbi:MAG: FHIPEP family type III secretion protein [Cyanobacteriota bacterium]